MASTDTTGVGRSDAPGERPMRADARRNRERLLKAAAEVFAEHGTDAQMDDVALRAGVGIGTVYRHFGDKEQLAGALVRSHFEHLAERAAHWLDAVAGEDPWGAFEGFVRETTENMANDVAQQRTMWTISPEGFAVAAGARDELHDVVGRLVATGQAAGVLREDFTVDDMPTLMCGLGSAMSVVDPETGAPRDWRRVLGFVLDGLRAR